MPVLSWPVALCPRSVSFHLQNTSRSGGVSLTGTEQIVTSPAARWSASVALSIHTDEQVLALRALVAGLDGQAGTVAVPVFDARRAPWPLDLAGRKITPRLAASGLDPSIRYRLAATAARGATSIAVLREHGSPLLPGQYFSIDGHLHLIVASTSATHATTLTIRPALRVSAAANTTLELARPVSVMRLANNDEGAADLNLGRFADLTLNFVEAIE